MSLEILRSAIAAGAEVGPVDSDGNGSDLLSAKNLKVSLSGGPKLLALDETTDFVPSTGGDEGITVKVAWFCWLNKDKSITEYIQAADESNVLHLKLLERVDLISWLDGSSTESEYIKVQAGQESAGAEQAAQGLQKSLDFTATVTKRPIPADMEAILGEEVVLADHQTVLHGSKNIDFSAVSTQCRREIIQTFREKQKRPHSKHSAAASTATPSSGTLTPGKNQDPIILLSPSPSSLINMANVKDFLEHGKFEPVLRQSSSSNFLRLARNSKLLGNVRFVVVDSTDQFKPEYWDRVVAVFVTGQAWQFKSYKWKDPNVLFHRVLGFALTYKGDQVPPQISQWNVKIEILDRQHRFRDREVVEHIWERIEANMIARGWPVKSS